MKECIAAGWFKPPVFGKGVVHENHYVGKMRNVKVFKSVKIAHLSLIMRIWDLVRNVAQENFICTFARTDTHH